MSYTALYRKFRPRIFDEVRGQDHIVKTLKNQIKSNRTCHAYLFCGTRGTGKTTVAKILAKSVNCENPSDGSPCMKCGSCLAIASGSSTNVIEIDAASNNSVDNVREIREEVAYRPTQGKYKVYIIDEVHMLSTGAFNALLKTLEEPPEYVIFILATTESSKIPVTILSRCQRYDFKRISANTISDRINELLEEEGIEAEEKGVKYLARAADGSMRDALSLLDQCIACYMGEKLTYDGILNVLGSTDVGRFKEILESVMNEDVSGSLRVLDDFAGSGKSMTAFAADFTWYLRNLLLIKNADELEDVIDMTTEDIAELKKIGESVNNQDVFRYIRIFSELSGTLRLVTQKRVSVELALIRMCRPQTQTDTESLAQRIRVLENKLDNREHLSPRNYTVSETVEFQTAKEEKFAEEKKNPDHPDDSRSEATRFEEPEVFTRKEKKSSQRVSESGGEFFSRIQAEWGAVISCAGGFVVRKYLKDVRLSYDNSDNKKRLFLITGSESAYDYLKEPVHKNEIINAVKQAIGETLEIEIVLEGGRNG